MAFDPASLRALINEHGVVVTVTNIATGAYNQTTGVVATTRTSYLVKAYFFNHDPTVAEFNTIVTGERRVVLSDILVNGSVTPAINAGDEISGFGDTVEVTRSSKITSTQANMCQMLYVKE